MKILFLVLGLSFLSGCSDSPFHTVIANKNMVIYSAAENKIERRKGKYEYWVSDESGKGWTLVTDDLYQLGDTLKIIIEK